MSKADSGGASAVSLSIDLELAIGRQIPQKQEHLEAVTAGMLELLDNCSLSATWGVSNPGLSAARDAILAARCGHEIAVLGDSIWLGSGTTCSRLAQEFERRFDGARRAGLEVSSLMLRHEVGQTLDLNLLLGHRITAVRGPAVASTVGEPIQRSGASRFGIWQVQNPIQIPLCGAWWHVEPWAFRRRLKESVWGGLPLHLVLNAGQMVEQPDLGLPRALAVLKQLAQQQAAGTLRIVTLRELARENLSRRVAHPSRSVLAA